MLLKKIEPIRLFVQERTPLVRHVYWSISAFNKEWYIVHTALNELSTDGKLVRFAVLTVRKFRRPAAQSSGEQSENIELKIP